MYTHDRSHFPSLPYNERARACTNVIIFKRNTRKIGCVFVGYPSSRRCYEKVCVCGNHPPIRPIRSASPAANTQTQQTLIASASIRKAMRLLSLIRVYIVHVRPIHIFHKRHNAWLPHIETASVSLPLSFLLSCLHKKEEIGNAFLESEPHCETRFRK